MAVTGNYIWYFTKSAAVCHEVTIVERETGLNITGEKHTYMVLGNLAQQQHLLPNSSLTSIYLTYKIGDILTLCKVQI
jgi:hypothetical protein